MDDVALADAVALAQAAGAEQQQMQQLWLFELAPELGARDVLRLAAAAARAADGGDSTPAVGRGGAAEPSEASPPLRLGLLLLDLGARILSGATARHVSANVASPQLQLPLPPIPPLAALAPPPPQQPQPPRERGGHGPSPPSHAPLATFSGGPPGPLGAGWQMSEDQGEALQRLNLLLAEVMPAAGAFVSHVCGGAAGGDGEVLGECSAPAPFLSLLFQCRRS